MDALRQQSWREQRGKTLFEKRIEGSLLPPSLGQGRHYTCAERFPWGSKVRRQLQAVVTLASPRHLHVGIHLGWEVRLPLRGGFWDILAGVGVGGQNEMIGQKEDKDPENCPFKKNLNFSKAWLSLWVPPRVFPRVLCFSNKLFTFLFIFCLLTWIHSRQGRQELGI